eukprot:scaffold47294_cov26-Tisochrysis_lutea.AAC.3
MHSKAQHGTAACMPQCASPVSATDELADAFLFRVCVGSGEAEGSYFHEELPKMLGLNDTKVRLITKELVGSRKRMMLVQVRLISTYI